MKQRANVRVCWRYEPCFPLPAPLCPQIRAGDLCDLRLTLWQRSPLWHSALMSAPTLSVDVGPVGTAPVAVEGLGTAAEVGVPYPNIDGTRAIKCVYYSAGTWREDGLSNVCVGAGEGGGECMY